MVKVLSPQRMHEIRYGHQTRNGLVPDEAVQIMNDLIEKAGRNTQSHRLIVTVDEAWKELVNRDILSEDSFGEEECDILFTNLMFLYQSKGWTIICITKGLNEEGEDVPLSMDFWINAFVFIFPKSLKTQK